MCSSAQEKIVKDIRSSDRDLFFLVKLYVTRRLKTYNKSHGPQRRKQPKKVNLLGSVDFLFLIEMCSFIIILSCLKFVSRNST